MVNVLVTGGAGFIGSNFVRYAINTHTDWLITTLDKLTYAGRRENLHDLIEHPRHRFIQGDITDAVITTKLVHEAEIIVHFAAETHVDRSLHNAGEFIQTDVHGTFVLLDAAREAKQLRRFVQISTDEVYGSIPDGASKETDELRPRNPYSASKAGASSGVPDEVNRHAGTTRGRLDLLIELRGALPDRTRGDRRHIMHIGRDAVHGEEMLEALTNMVKVSDAAKVSESKEAWNQVNIALLRHG